MAEREVFITGVGLTTALGNNVEDNWNNIRAMKTGIACYPRNGIPNFLQYMGKVEQPELPQDIPHKLMGQMKFLNRGSILGFCSSFEAISRSQLNISEITPGRRALYIASGDFTKVGYDFMYPAIKNGTDDSWSDINYEKLNNAVMSKVNPFFLLESLSNNLFSFLSAYLEFMGSNTSLASLSPLGGNAIELAYRSIKQNKADIALAVGYCNWITEIPLYELEGLGILSKCISGVQSYRPFERSRDGFIPGEGGSAILLEADDVARRRNAKILAKIKGFGNSIEFAPNSRLSVADKISKRSILSAMEEASCSIKDFSFITPHGSGTRKGDRSELRSVSDIVGSMKSELPICGLKPYTGHMGAASDIAEVIIGINSVKDKLVPATLNFKETESEFSDLKISGSHQTCSKQHFLSVSYGVGGQSSSVVIEVL
jgi:3-oxoacyl-[acyl-carrier-protein] synthase II